MMSAENKVYLVVAGWTAIAGPMVIAAVWYKQSELSTGILKEYKAYRKNGRHLFKWKGRTVPSVDPINVEAELSQKAICKTDVVSVDEINAAGDRMYDLVRERMEKTLYGLLDEVDTVENLTIITSGNYPIILGLNCSLEAGPHVTIARWYAQLIRQNYLELEHKRLPDYKLDEHHGHATKSHFELLLKHGPDIHIHHLNSLKKLPHWICTLIRAYPRKATKLVKYIHTPPNWWRKLFPALKVDDLLSQQDIELLSNLGQWRKDSTMQILMSEDASSAKNYLTTIEIEFAQWLRYESPFGEVYDPRMVAIEIAELTTIKREA